MFYTITLIKWFYIKNEENINAYNLYYVEFCIRTPFYIFLAK